MPVVFRHEGDWNKTDRFLRKAKNISRRIDLNRYGQRGVELLKQATPVDTGKTADSWDYFVERNKHGATIVFTNSNVQNKVPIAIVLQYGHGAINGGYIQGRNYINPAIQPLFDEIMNDAWREASRR